jgi:hypothetical protein
MIDSPLENCFKKLKTGKVCVGVLYGTSSEVIRTISRTDYCIIQTHTKETTEDTLVTLILFWRIGFKYSSFVFQVR